MKILKEDLLKVENYLLSHFAKGNFEVNKDDIFNQLSCSFTKKLKKNDFYIGIAQAIVGDKFTKIGVDQKDMNLILFDKNKKPDEPEKTFVSSLSEAVKKPFGPFTTLNSRRTLWINDSEYSVPLSSSMINAFLYNIMEAKNDPNGIIVFDGKRFSGDEKLLHRFLINFVGCNNPKVSEPVFSNVDGDGVPLCLK